MSFSTTKHNSALRVLDNHISIQDAADYSGYNIQYLRRLVRDGVIIGIKIGQVWLIQIPSLEQYLKTARVAEDRRFGPRVYQEYIQSKER